jgi:hypothetical protein
MKCAVVLAASMLIAVPLRASAQVDDKDVVVPPPASSTAPAEPPAVPTRLEVVPPSFGAPGEVVVSGAFGVGASDTTYDSQASSLSLSLNPVVDVFVARNISLGVSLDISYGDSRGYGADNSLVDTTTTSISGAVRGGVVLPITGSLSFWPRGFVGFEWVRQNEQAANGSTTSIADSPLGQPTTTHEGPWLELWLPLTLDITPHVFASFGPSIFHDFSITQGGPDRTFINAGLEIGGWFGGCPDTIEVDADDPQPIEQRFGSRHELVITNAIVAQGSWTGYAGSHSSDSSLTFSPGLDYFVDKHFSIGVTASASYSSATGIDSTTGGEVTYSHHAYGVAPRIGVVIPFGTHVSLWPTASVGIGGGAYAEREGPNSDDYSEWYVWISTSAPVLVQVASHFFVGFGPYASTDITHPITYASSSSQNRATSFGAGFVVGGVL